MWMIMKKEICYVIEPSITDDIHICPVKDDNIRKLKIMRNEEILFIVTPYRLTIRNGSHSNRIYSTVINSKSKNSKYGLHTFEPTCFNTVIAKSAYESGALKEYVSMQKNLL